MQIISRKEAREAGLARYYTGKPCKWGHYSERLVSTGICRVCHLEHQKKRWASDPEYRERQKEVKRRHKKNNPNYNQRQLQLYKFHYRNNKEFKIKAIIRAMVTRAVRPQGSSIDKRKSCSLDYTPKELHDHMQRQFSKGMSWDNHGEWHIDHIKPISQYIKEGVTDPAVINALPNLRPIWASENFRKSNSVQFLI